MFSAWSPGLRLWTLLVSFFGGGGDSGDGVGNDVSGGNVCMLVMFPRQLSERGQILAAADRDVQLPYF